MGSLDTWIEYWGHRGPTRPALAADDRLVTWGTLADRSNRLAAGLVTEGVRPGDRVGVLSRDPVKIIQVVSACARLGAVAMPLDPLRAPTRLLALMVEAEPSVMVVDADLAGAVAPALPAGRTFVAGPGEENERPLVELLGRGSLGRSPAIGMDEPLLVLHTRGTTGAPKAVVLTHGNVEAVAVAVIAADGLVPKDRVAVAPPSPAAPAGLAATLAALHAGALVRFAGDEGPAALFGDADPLRPTILAAAAGRLEPSGLAERLAALGAAAPRMVKVIGPVPERLRQAFQAAGVPLLETYGLAEGGGLNLQQPVHGAPSDGMVPLLGQEARVVDPEGAAVPAGQPGELVLAGSAVTRGHRTAGTPGVVGGAVGGGVVHTGDRAVADRHGRLTILGRTTTTTGEPR